MVNIRSDLQYSRTLCTQHKISKTTADDLSLTWAVDVCANHQERGNDGQLLLAGGQAHGRVQGDPPVPPWCVHTSAVLENGPYEAGGLKGMGMGGET